MSSSRLSSSWADEVERSERKKARHEKDLPQSDNRRQPKDPRKSDFKFTGYKSERTAKINPSFKRVHSETIEKNNSDESDNEAEASAARRRKWSERNVQNEKRVNSNNDNNLKSSSRGENNPAVLAQRQKQIDYGKNTVAYERYMELVPRAERTNDQPRTPNKYGKYSRRAFDGLIKIWRKQLHQYDPPEADEQGKEDDSSEDSDSD